MGSNLTMSVFYAIIISFVVLLMAYRIYKSIKHPLVLSMFLLFVWSLTLIFTNIILDDIDIIRPIGFIGLLALSSSFYLAHYHFDDLTALYKQRISMSIGSISYGTAMATFIYENGVFRQTKGPARIGIIILIPLFVQSGSMIYRFYLHIVNQNSLTQHYALQSRYSSFVEKYGVFILIMLFVISALIAFALAAQPASSRAEELPILFYPEPRIR